MFRPTHRSYGHAISADGRFVAFGSQASNLVPNDTNGQPDIFVHDWETGATTLVSLWSGGAQADYPSYSPAISADGRWVAFHTDAALVADDTNHTADVYVHDRLSGATTPVSVGTGGAQANAHSSAASVSADGRVVAFQSGASNLVPGDTNGEFDVFVHDCETGITTRVSVGPGGMQAFGGPSSFPTLSADGPRPIRTGERQASFSPANSAAALDTTATANAPAPMPWDTRKTLGAAVTRIKKPHIASSIQTFLPCCTDSTKS